MTVNALPVPTIAGPTPVCVNSTGNVYTTQAGMTNYIWTVSGGTITAGGTTNSNTVTVTWTTVGVETVKVNYTNGAGCTAAAPFVYNVTVNALPVPTITGPASVCVNSAGNVYTTQAGMTNYIWSVSAGGTVTAGGGAANNTVTVTWTVVGAQTVSVNYTNANGCTAAAPVVYNVTVNALPTPSLVAQTTLLTQDWSSATLNGNTPPAGWGLDVVLGSNITYYMSQGTWPTVAPYGGDTRLVDFESFSYSSGTNRLKMTTPVSTVGFTNVTVDFAWYTDNGYPGTNTEGVTVQWSTNGSTWNNSTFFMRYNAVNQWVIELVTLPAGAQGQPTLYVAFLFNSNYGDDCHMDIMHIKASPASTAVCAGSTGNVYVTDAGMTNYIWSVSAGGTITAGGTTNSNTVTITWNTVGAQTVSVNYTNANGCTAAAPTVYSVTVNALPSPTIAGPRPFALAPLGMFIRLNQV